MNYIPDQITFHIDAVSDGVKTGSINFTYNIKADCIDRICLGNKSYIFGECDKFEEFIYSIFPKERVYKMAIELVETLSTGEIA